MKRFIVYAIRWQLSNFVLAPVMMSLAYFNIINFWVGAAVANLVGAIIFFFVDRWIFNSKSLSTEWDVRYGHCDECGKKNIRVYRLIKWKNYDRSNDKSPKYRCEECSIVKEKQVYGLL